MNHPRTRRAYAPDHGIAEMRRSAALAVTTPKSGGDGMRIEPTQDASTAPRRRFEDASLMSTAIR